MTVLVLLVVIALTSAGGYLVGARALGLPAAALRTAAGCVLDCAGLAALFLAANLVVGGLLVLGGRALSGQFVSIYALDDVSLAGLSLLQALAFAWWRAAARR